MAEHRPNIDTSYWIDVKSKEDEHSSYHTHGTNYINRITDIADITSMHTRLKFHRSSFNSLPPSTMFIARTLASSTYKIHSTLNAQRSLNYMVTSICILEDQIRCWWLLLIMASHGSDVCKSRRLLYLVYAVQVLQFLFRVHVYILIIHQVEHGANFRQEKKGEANSYSQAEHDRNSLCTTQTPPQQRIFQSLHKAKQKKRKECFLLLSRFCFFF